MSVRQMLPAFIIAGTVVGFFVFSPVGFGQQRGPAIVPRDLSDPSINEGPSGRTSAGYKQNVFPQLGRVPASYEWFGGFLQTLGSFFQPFNIDPTYLGQRFGQQPFFYSLRGGVSRLYAGAKGIGGKNVTDVPQLGQVCGTKPGDTYWVGYPRPGNVEIPPPFQLVGLHEWDCFCRCDENIECPRKGPFQHRNWDGPLTTNVPCRVCFGDENIRKHDVYVGTSHGTFPGYPRGAPADPGYQECLRQSSESFAASGPGGQPRDSNIFGI